MTLADIASGNYRSGVVNPGTTIVQNGDICGLLPNPAPTGPSTLIDTSKLVGNMCGYFEIAIDSSNTANPTALYILGGCVMGDAGESTTEQTIIRALYASMGTTAFAVNIAGFLDGTSDTGAVFARAGLSAYLNECVFGNTAHIISNIDFQDAGSTDAGFNSFKSSPWLLRDLNIANNFGGCKVNADPDRCSRCFNSDDRVITWRVLAPIAGLQLIAIRVPQGVVGTFRFCVAGYAAVDNFVECAGGMTL